MSGAAGLDLRYPIGGLFVVLGVLLTAYGIATNGNAEMYARSTGVNVNLWWGIVMVVVGALFLVLASRGRREDARRASEGAGGREGESRDSARGASR